jgi:hypothetical protein
MILTKEKTNKRPYYFSEVLHEEVISEDDI